MSSHGHLTPAQDRSSALFPRSNTCEKAREKVKCMNRRAGGGARFDWRQKKSSGRRASRVASEGDPAAGDPGRSDVQRRVSIDRRAGVREPVVSPVIIQDALILILDNHAAKIRPNMS